MKLIDADKLVEILNKNSIFRTVTNAEDKNVIEIINEQPTAFDVDKVVEQLEVLSEKHFKRYYDCMEQKDKEMALKHSLKFCSYDDAIDIVKAGGIDEVNN